MHQTRVGVIRGLSATVVMVAAMFAGRFTLGTPLLPQLIAEEIFARVTPKLFTVGIRLFGAGAKWVTFGIAIAGYVAGGVLLGWLYARWVARHLPLQPRWSGLLYGTGVWLVVMTLGLPLLEMGFFGVRLRGGAAMGALGLLGLHLLYGGVLGWLTGRGMPASPTRRIELAQPSSLSRRVMLHGIAAIPVLWLTTSGLGRVLGAIGTRLAQAAELVFEGIKGLSAEVTPNVKFYTISKNLFSPTVNPRTWILKVHGLVDHPLRLTLEELRAMPPHEEYATFLCISNEVGGNLIGNAKWKGVPLKNLLERARVKAGARKAVFRADDGYSTGIPLERCLRPQTLLAYEMNGKELPDDHGFPVRVVVPGYYGMKQPKWLTEIEIVASDYKGYWEQRGWADEALVKTMSRVDVPPHRGEVSRAGAVIGGVAFAGDRGIGKVEVSIDGGKTWREATVKQPLSPYTWVLWAGEWDFPREGDYNLAVRAADGQGNLQEEQLSDPLPDGATGYHKLRVKVKGT